MSARPAATDPELLRAATEAAAALNLPPIASAWMGAHVLLTMAPVQPPTPEEDA